MDKRSQTISYRMLQKPETKKKTKYQSMNPSPKMFGAGNFSEE